MLCPCDYLSEITAAYLRLYDSRRLPQIAEAGENSRAWQHAIAVDDALMCWSEITPAFINPSVVSVAKSRVWELSI
ncbi:hypothetical protein ANSO36C_58410 [Nostoc cf. commune SO-36]|uniref:Uncharacterized protein n=1 Tax=Nostoc cf. commune SO-36 TaxID=449208 RepID=A0ABM7Z9Y4_NOSCO|nr:hypothetical protein [Nostoc commune]BDI20039.1 hypothetical protein ANSO36C_58410 [Nostoc cf. commune SO-36]